MRKFADKEQAIKQVNGSNTEATLILCGYSGERANYSITGMYYIMDSISILLYLRQTSKDAAIVRFS